MIKGRYTPWDESALKLKTYEILEIDTLQPERTAEALNNNSFCVAELIYGRFPANDFKIKELLIKNGYIPCETSFRVTLGQLKNYTLPKIYTRRQLNIITAKKSEFTNIAEIARDMFKFSRFHEDPYINKDLANDRMCKWVNDLGNQNVSCLVSKLNSGEIVSFMIYKIDERKQAELILGGSKKGFEMHSPFFWGAVISNLKLEDINRISTTVSAANSGVLSLYQDLGFKIISTNTDYHKHV